MTTGTQVDRKGDWIITKLPSGSYNVYTTSPTWNAVRAGGSYFWGNWSTLYEARAQLPYYMEIINKLPTNVDKGAKRSKRK
jgi:hypothetical protein